MNQRIIGTALLAIGLIGCARSDPANSPLETGSEAIIYDPKERGAAAEVPVGSVGDRLGLGLSLIDIGTRVTIVDDRVIKDGNGLPKVRIFVREGAYQGQARIDRKYLRPVPK